MGICSGGSDSIPVKHPIVINASCKLLWNASQGVYNLQLKEAASILKIYLNSTLLYFNLPADHTPYTSLHVKY